MKEEGKRRDASSGRKEASRGSPTVSPNRSDVQGCGVEGSPGEGSARISVPAGFAGSEPGSPGGGMGRHLETDGRGRERRTSLPPSHGGQGLFLANSSENRQSRNSGPGKIFESREQPGRNGDAPSGGLSGRVKRLEAGRSLSGHNKQAALGTEVQTRNTVVYSGMFQIRLCQIRLADSTQTCWRRVPSTDLLTAWLQSPLERES